MQLPDGVTRVDVDSEAALLTARYDLTSDAAYLIRPDGHVAARFKHVTARAVMAAHEKAMGR